jgi:hypothetical protein
MKIATETAVNASPDTIWKTLTGFAAYPEWNRVLKSVQGEAAPDAALQVQIQFYGQNVSKLSGKVTGFIPPKYFSWSWSHALGAWFLATEHVFRLKERDDGSVIFFQEMYYTGLGLKFRRSSIEHMARLTLDKLNDDLKSRVEPAPAA